MERSNLFNVICLIKYVQTYCKFVIFPALLRREIFKFNWVLFYYVVDVLLLKLLQIIMEKYISIYRIYPHIILFPTSIANVNFNNSQLQLIFHLWLIRYFSFNMLPTEEVVDLRRTWCSWCYQFALFVHACLICPLILQTRWHRGVVVSFLEKYVHDASECKSYTCWNFSGNC